MRNDRLMLDAALLEQVLQRLAVIEAGQARIEAFLVRGRGAQEEAGRRLILAIAAAAEGFPFRAGHVFLRSRQVPELAAALEAALIDNAKQLGKLLARFEGATVDHVRLERDRAGLWWCVPVSGM